MALVIEATAGHASANSYGTIGEADLYFEGRLSAAAWDDASADDKARALVTATARLEHEHYHGARASETQALAWPRTGLTRDGIEVSGATVPTFIKRASFEEALALLEDPEKYADTGLQAFESIKAGSLALGIRGEQAGPSQLAPAAARLLRDVRIGGGGNSVRFIRS